MWFQNLMIRIGMAIITSRILFWYFVENKINYIISRYYLFARGCVQSQIGHCLWDREWFFFKKKKKKL
jgi:hypothetical protein